MCAESTHIYFIGYGSDTLRLLSYLEILYFPGGSASRGRRIVEANLNILACEGREVNVAGIYKSPVRAVGFGNFVGDIGPSRLIRTGLANKNIAEATEVVAIQVVQSVVEAKFGRGYTREADRWRNEPAVGSLIAADVGRCFCAIARSKRPYISQRANANVVDSEAAER